MPTKTIHDFIAGKIVRSELQEHVQMHVDSDPHPELGVLEAVVLHNDERVSFFRQGFAISQTVIRYEDLKRIAESPSSSQRCQVALGMMDGTGFRADLGAPLARVVFATLRWIGRAQLRRRLDESS